VSIIAFPDPPYARPRRRLSDPSAPPIPDLDASVAAFLADQHAAGRAKLSCKRHAQSLRQLAHWLDAECLSWHEATAPQLRRFVRSRAHLSASSRANLVWTLRAFYRWSVEEGLIAISPAAALTTPRRTKPVPRALSKAQVRALVAFLAAQHRPASRRDEVLMLTALYAGLRRAELAALIWGDIDLQSGVITVRLSKMGHGRSVVLHPVLIEVLARWRALQGGVDEGAVFDWAGEALSPDRIGRIMARTSRRAGIVFSAHTLRHTFATHAYRHGRDIRSVSRALGHQEIRQTLIYVACDPEDSRTAVESLPALADW